MDGAAVRPRFDYLIHPEGVGRVVVQDDLPASSDKELPCYLIGDVLALIDEQAVTGRAMHLPRIVYGEELQDRSVLPCVGGLCLVPPALLPQPLGLHDGLEVTDRAPPEVWHGFRDHRVDGGRFGQIDLFHDGEDEGLQDGEGLGGTSAPA